MIQIKLFLFKRLLKRFTLQNVCFRCEKVVQELGHQKGRSLVLLPVLVQFVLNLETLVLDLLIVILTRLQLVLDGLQLALQEVDQAFTFEVLLICALFHIFINFISILAFSSTTDNLVQPLSVILTLPIQVCLLHHLEL